MKEMQQGFFWAQSLMLGLTLGGMGVPALGAQQAQPELQEIPAQPRRLFSPPDWVPIPEGLTIVLVREDAIPGQFRILDVELSREIEEAEIEMIANLLRDSDDMVYDRTYIVYYLPGMRSGEVGWAISHFSPDLEVRLIGPP